MDIDRWFVELDRITDVPFMDDGRHQPRLPPAENFITEFARVPGLVWEDWTRA